MRNRQYALLIGIILIFTSALAGCVQEAEPLPLTEEEIGEWSVVVTIAHTYTQLTLPTKRIV